MINVNPKTHQCRQLEDRITGHYIIHTRLISQPAKRQTTL